jgi:tRNA pseudouridine(38-40) synthase
MITICVVLLLLYVASTRSLQSIVPQQSSHFASSVRCYGHNVEDVEHRVRYFWEQSPFRVAEQIVHHVLTTGNQFSRLLQPLKQEKNDDACFFPYYYTGNISYPIEKYEQVIPTFKFKKKQSFRLVLAYAGQYFCGWQRQPNNVLSPSVQEVVEGAIQSAFIENGRPDVRVSGRTDSGVHALGQVARVRILAKGGPYKAATLPVSVHDVFETLYVAANEANFTWRCLSVTTASDSFHPTFGTISRSYIYTIDATALSDLCISFLPTCIQSSRNILHQQLLEEIVVILNSLLEILEDKELDYIAFSYGKVKTESTLCSLQHAKVRLCKEVVSKSEETVLTFEFTGNRFLRRMVRKLVGTSLHIAIQIFIDASTLTNHATGSGCQQQQLIEICNSRKRTSLVKTAPPGGLIFISANCFDRVYSTS